MKVRKGGVGWKWKDGRADEVKVAYGKSWKVTKGVLV